MKTVAVFPYEDRLAEYRLKADESYEIGERGHPVRAYLDIERIVRAAKEAQADAIYPGYGFLSENAGLARRCREEGITFIGPSAEVLDLTGNKATAIAAAREAGLPVLRGAEPSDDVPTLMAAAEQIGYPVFVKAVAGGGGRGMRRVDEPDRLPSALEEAMREADAAFGDSRVYLEQSVEQPRQIEVQILADAAGDVIHLYRCGRRPGGDHRGDEDGGVHHLARRGHGAAGGAAAVPDGGRWRPAAGGHAVVMT